MLKRYFFLFLAITSLKSAQVEAQTEFGIVGGINSSNFAVNDTGIINDYNPFTGFELGGSLELNLSERLLLRLEPSFLQKGARHEFLTEVFRHQLQYKIIYLETPVFLKLTLGSSALLPYVMVGPTLGLELDSKFTSTLYIHDKKLSDAHPFDVGRLFRTFDFGIGIGTGINFLLGNRSMFVQAVYVLGLANIRNEVAFNYTINDIPVKLEREIRNRSLRIMIGLPVYLF
jgi:hypothetical protein